MPSRIVAVVLGLLVLGTPLPSQAARWEEAMSLQVSRELLQACFVRHPVVQTMALPVLTAYAEAEAQFLAQLSHRHGVEAAAARLQHFSPMVLRIISTCFVLESRGQREEGVRE